MNEMEAIWKRLSDLGTVRYSRDRGEPDPTPPFPYEIAFTPKQWEEFHRRLLPLLEAGQAMRDHVDTLTYEDENEPHNCSGCGDSIKKWDAALHAAQEK